ncbi:hypothetical protein EVAR_87907_1 [Eumeta japonica]|uniref:Uncharacterized protein n=1 Tax=Eumeta variegata TaxID=151549 RepID=A0A4C1WXN4_EUMVA|nr:hypothetical protein EVAR_87907_1 [Eumeta japonica]
MYRQDTHSQFLLNAPRIYQVSRLNLSKRLTRSVMREIDFSIPNFPLTRRDLCKCGNYVTRPGATLPSKIARDALPCCLFRSRRLMMYLCSVLWGTLCPDGRHDNGTWRMTGVRPNKEWHSITLHRTKLRCFPAVLF